MSLVHPPTKSPKRDYDESFTQETDDNSKIPFQPQSVGIRSSLQREASPIRDAESTTPSRLATDTPFASLDKSAPPPSKKPKTSSAAEKELRQLEKQTREAERAAEKAKKEAERKEQLEEKARRDAEKEAERKKREADKAEKEAERKKREAEKEEKRLKREQEKKQKEEEKKQKEEEKRQKEEEKKRKERSQPTLSSFFAIPSTRRGSLSDRDSKSPGPSTNTPFKDSNMTNAQATPSKSRPLSEYEKKFPEFFVYPDVKLAPINRFERDSGALESLQSTIDSYLEGNRSPTTKRSFDAATLFHMRNTTVLRGKRLLPVREIMADMSGQANRPIDLTTDSQNSQIKRRTELLRQVPLKYLRFQEDVRPPYHGTYTSRPVSSIASLARNFKRRDLPNTDYDYDSEAEWVEDEDAEDCLNSDGEEEEEGDDLEDLDGFLDDENDEGLNPRKMAVQGDLEPVSTGLCWEDRKKRNTNVKMMPYRMEFMLEGSFKSIDPFSTDYWEPSPTSNGGSMNPPRLPLHAVKGTSIFNNPSTTKTVNTFFSNGSQAAPTPTASASASLPKKMITPDALEDFKQAVVGSDLSKVGLIEVLKKKFPKQTGAAIKGTLEMVAKRVGEKAADKRWVLIQ